MRQAGEAAEELGVEIIGGHTEITPAVTKPVIVSTAIGRALKGSSQQAKEMKPGDYVLMTKWAGLEGTGIIAGDCESQLADVLTPEELEEAKGLLAHVSVVREGILAGKIGTSGMHDITEGGILGALWEMCQIAGVGAELWLDKIPVTEVTKKISNHYGIDYLRLISSGCMMIVATPEKRQELEEALTQANIPVACIGVIKAREEGIYMMAGDEKQTVAPPASDELYKVIF